MTARLVLPLLSVFALYAIFYFAEINGLNRLAFEAISAKTLPGTNEPLRIVYTGIARVDEVLAALTIFFWPATDGSNPTLTLHSVAFSGTFGAAWTLVTLESWRRGNVWTIAAFPMMFGLLAQVLTFAFAAPLYCAFQLYSSVTARNPNAENIRIPRAVLDVVPLVFIVGFMVPTLLMILPVSEHVTVDMKQIFIASWHPWPAYVAIALTIINIVFSPFVSGDRSVEGGRANLRSLRFVYAFAFANAALTHLISWIVSLATVVVPAIFEKRLLAALHPFKVFEIALPWTVPALQVSDIGQGVHVFLRWDYLIGSAGVLVWALSLYKTAHLVVYGRVGWLDLLKKVALLVTLAGPVGAAVELMWERDELIIYETGGMKREGLQEKKTS
ncbi:hypothetical protein CNMCM5793_002743 [Aspergillus hiratsukae]|uniref:AtmA protein n=1 Tax=Aspergillus hiratsukae TaxID=1194566 RepID=A0A8H6PD43_9EURO|nr:hypothetical protein CNMCM5793_002743 [Aspergillus hiratsukae]KAF7168022.1 hypothetical protein CNMCM6106_003344 [Aspergillus hiratsukae]